MALVLIVGLVVGAFLGADLYQGSVEATHGGGHGGVTTGPPPPTNGIGRITSSVAGQNTPELYQANYPSCNIGAGGDTACFNPQASGSCSYAANPNPYAVQISVFDQNGNPLSGASVSLSGVGVSVSASPSATVVTNGAGAAQFSQVQGTVPPNDPSGGYLAADVSYASGGVTSTGSVTLLVSPPSAANC